MSSIAKDAPPVDDPNKDQPKAPEGEKPEGEKPKEPLPFSGHKATCRSKYLFTSVELEYKLFTYNSLVKKACNHICRINAPGCNDCNGRHVCINTSHCSRTLN